MPLLKPLIEKALHAVEWSEEEARELAQLDPDALRTALDEAQSRLESLENERLSKEERLQRELETLKTTYAALQEEHSALRRRQRVEALSRSGGCTDPEYLDFRAQKEGVDLDDPEASSAFLAALARTSPGCFLARIAPGSSAGTLSEGKGNLSGRESVSPLADGDRIGRIAGELEGLS